MIQNRDALDEIVEKIGKEIIQCSDIPDDDDIKELFCTFTGEFPIIMFRVYFKFNLFNAREYYYRFNCNYAH